MVVRADVLTVSGLPGSGTSTVCKLLSEETGWKHIDAGKIFREMAELAGISLSELGCRAEKDPHVDRGLDTRMIQAVHDRCGGLILEGRLTGWMVVRAELAAFKVWMSADAEVRAKRVGQRDGRSVEEARQAIAHRERSESVRYRDHHGIVIEDLSIYDKNIDTSVQTAEHIAQGIAGHINAVWDR